MDGEHNSLKNSIDTDLVTDIIRVVSHSDGFFRHQQIGEADLTTEEKSKISSELLASKPAVFLSRYGKFLSEEQLEYFDQLKTSNYELEYLVNQTRQGQCRFIKQNKVKNRRYAALKKMLDDNDDYFGETEMKARNPLLYDQLIGKFLTKEEKEDAARPDMTNCSLTNIILEHMDLNKERDDHKKMKADEEEEEFDTDDEEDEDTNSAEDSEQIAKQEGGREFLRQQFVKSAYQSFLGGKDAAFDYSKVDNDDSLDDLDMEQRDAEERYFEDSDIDE